MSDKSTININPREPQQVSKAYLPVFIFRNARAWIVLLLVYTAGPLLRGEGFVEFAVIGGISINIITIILAGIAVFAIIIIIFSLLSYQRIRWQITEEEVRIRKGILRRVDKRIPISKIQSVDITEKLIERFFKVATVSFDTPGGNADDGKIPCLDIEVCEYIRELVFAVKNNPEFRIEHLEEEIDNNRGTLEINQNDTLIRDKQVIYKMPVKSLILTGLSNGKSLVFAFIILSTATQIVSTLFGEGIYNRLIYYASGLALPLLIGLAILFFVISWASSIVAAVISFFGFTVRNIGSKIEVEQGLFDHKTISIEKHRIQEVRVSQGFIRRIIGFAEISVKIATLKETSGNNGAGETKINGSTIIHPFIALKEVDFFLSKLLPEYEKAPKQFSPLPPKAHSRSIRRYVIWCLVIELAILLITGSIISSVTGVGAFYIFATNFIPIISICGLIILFFAITGHLSYKNRSVSKNDLFISLRKGAWGLLFTYIPRRKIQIAKVSENPFQRFSKLATIKGTTGAHSFPTLMDTSTAFAYDFLEWSVTKKM